MGTEDSEGVKYGNRRQRGMKYGNRIQRGGEVWESKTARG